jgi:hypothetical protein
MGHPPIRGASCRAEKERSAILTAGHQDSLDWCVGAGDERGNIVVQFFERLQEAGY